MNQRCIENQTPPDLQLGAIVDDGEFFRNLKKDHVAKRYENDSDGDPRFGFKITKRHWKDANRQAGGLSVNLRSCIHSEVCSLTLLPCGEHYFHVAVLDLQAMNGSGLLTSPLVAQYSPVEETHNRCHFEIVPRDSTALGWMELGVLLDNPFPQAKVPSTEEEKSRADAACTQYRSYCDIRRWVRREDGKLAI
jgi:hypothetical protein